MEAGSISSPKVSVCVITYNQEKYIRQCLQSIVDQETDFDFEVIVGEDCSTDGTRAIVQEFAERYPLIVKPIYQEKNIGGGVNNLLAVHGMAIGEYVAHMDGDDFLLPGKLQSQAKFLDSHSDCNVCWHRMLFTDGVINIEHPSKNFEFVGQRLYQNDLCALGPFGAHSSTMYRRSDINFNILNIRCNDWFYSIIRLGDGFGWMMPDVLGSYRIHRNGISSGARPTRANRLLLINSQLQALDYIKLNAIKFIAVRAWANFFLDLFRLRTYCIFHLRVLFSCKFLPEFSYFPKLYRFYKWSRLPKDFH